MFSVHTTPVILDLCLRKTRAGGRGGQGSYCDYHNIIVLRKASFSTCFLFTLKRKAGVFKFLQLEERFRKALFCDGLLWTVGLTEEISCVFKFLNFQESFPKAAFLNSSGGLWTWSNV